MEIKKNYSLKSLHTFNMDVDGKYFCEVASVAELREALQFAKSQRTEMLVLGGGSNVLFTTGFEGLVIKINMAGKEVVREDEKYVWVKSGGGENWDRFVAYCVDHGYGGIENLSLIPGCVGAGPIQNIGAYGVELKDHFESLEFYHFNSGAVEVFEREDCNFGYRNSIFKNELKGKGVILSVTLKLDKIHVLKTGYGSIQQELVKLDKDVYTISDLRNVVTSIRQSKLPDPEEIGNAGSFFKNPEVSAQTFSSLKVDYPDIVGYPIENGNMKLAAGWLIDQCGWKGFRDGDAGVHAKQALVLVNYGSASGKEIYDLSEKIKISVKKKFGVNLEREVNVV